MAISRVCSIPDCGKPAYNVRGWCSLHYQRWRHHGDPLGGRTGKGDLLRFIHETVLSYEGNECLSWPYGKNKKGYGHIRLNGRFHSAHRLVCEMVNGQPPTPDLHAAHSCGNGHLGCVTPNHLSWKTRAENMRDMVNHGTASSGVKRPSAKLSVPQVEEILRYQGSKSTIAVGKEFGVSSATISSIWKGKKWRSVSRVSSE